MAILKCKMCGGDLNIMEGNPICECEFCGTTQTVPQADNEKKANLFNRANRLRMNAEFDRAASVYASITAEFPEEAEAFWGLCLCKYGIEYVDDPATGNKIPTCHRTLSESILDDEDFIQACENADPVAKRVYREEAKAIDRLQQDILSIVANEAPYDVFICYKETDETGSRTEDSVLAQDIYDSLTGKGLKVFFARITLEDKLGQQYEPYIYAALHSAKVMLAVGTQFDYYDAVWVKNEWARFLDMMKTDREKTLIPCYKGIDAYDMPREFKNLQAQDMGKLGWLQDLTRGVMKLCKNENGSNDEDAVNQAQENIYKANNPTMNSLLQRASMFIEDKLWDDASQYADRVLDIDTENASAYLVKLMARCKAGTLDELGRLKTPLTIYPEYNRIIRFGNDEIKQQVQQCNEQCESTYAGFRERYNHGIQILKEATTIAECNDAKKIFENIKPYYKAAEKAINSCHEKTQQLKKMLMQQLTDLAIDIRNKALGNRAFSKVLVGGYNIKAVDSFLQIISNEILNNEGNNIDEVITDIKYTHALHADASVLGYNKKEVIEYLKGLITQLRRIDCLLKGKKQKANAIDRKRLSRSDLIAKIEKEEFTIDRKGYDAEKVNEFLDSVCDCLEDGTSTESIIQMINAIKFPEVRNGYSFLEIENFLKEITKDIEVTTDGHSEM